MAVALAPSHLLCMLPLTWAIRARGHEVVVAGRPEVAEAARRAGLTAFAVPELPDERLPEAASAAVPSGAAPRPVPAFAGLRARLTEEQRRESAAREARPGPHPWERRVRRVLDGYLAAGRRWRPDLLLCDPLEFTGLVAAGVLGVPVVVHRWGGPDALSSEALRRARVVLGPLCAEYGLDDGPRPPDLVIDPCPPSLRFAEADPALPMRFVPCGGSGRPLPDWARRPAPGGRVYVSFGVFGSRAGTAGADFIAPGRLPDTFRALAAALPPGGGREVVFSVPPALSEAAADLPRWVRRVDWIPLDAVLRPEDVVVHHGGVGSAMTACARGAVQLVLPPGHPVLLECAAGLTARGVARSVEAASIEPPGGDGVPGESGAPGAPGESGAPGTPGVPGALAEAVREVLEHRALRADAAELAAEIAALPAPAAVVSTLERL